MYFTAASGIYITAFHQFCLEIYYCQVLSFHIKSASAFTFLLHYRHAFFLSKSRAFMHPPFIAMPQFSMMPFSQ